MKKVSIIIPAFNNSELTIKCLNSIFSQTYQNIEIIVVNDGSTDDTEYKLKAYKDRINYYYQKNQGACSARNLGMKHSTGDYIAHIDCDDIYYPYKIEKCVNFLEINNNYGFVYTDANIIDKNDKVITSLPKFSNHPGSGYITSKILTSHHVLTNSTLLAKRECFLKVGNFDENIFLSADREMLIRLSTEYKAGFIDEKLTGYRVGNGRVYQNLDKSIQEFLYVIKKYENTKFLKSKRQKDLCYLNIYYNFLKLYASVGRIDKSKELIYKILKRSFLFNKIHYVLISLIFLYIYPEIIHKYFQKYNNNI
tara:strand:+ start:442 stop:1368 length:927 start_codon:yes stop_codon:yes gene_type:complete